MLFTETSEEKKKKQILEQKPRVYMFIDPLSAGRVSRLTWSVNDVGTRVVRDAIEDGLAAEEADVGQGGIFDDETLLALPNDVRVWKRDWGKEVLWEKNKKRNRFYRTTMMNSEL